MTRIIPAKVHFDKDGDDPPKLILEEGASDLSELITDRGIEIEQEWSCDCPEPGHEPDHLHNHGTDVGQPEALDSAEPDAKPRNGFQQCMSDALRRPDGSEKLTRGEARERFKEAVQICKRQVIQLSDSDGDQMVEQ